MNSISWMIYLTEVISNIKETAIILAVILGFAHIMYIVISLMEGWNFRRWPFVVLIVLIIVAIVTPSKNTMYAIAASEVGERIATMPESKELASDALKAVRSWVKSQIKEDIK